MTNLLTLLKKQPTLNNNILNFNKITLLHFWDTRCPSCVAKMPELVLIYQKYKPKGLEFIGICLDENKEVVIKFIEANNIAWPQIFDSKSWNGELILTLGINSLPTNLFLNQNGEIIDLSLEAQITGLLAT